MDKKYFISTLYKCMDKKCCAKCKKEKCVLEFYRKKTENRYSSWCKQCVYDNQKNRWINRKYEAIRLLGGSCIKCGYKKCIAALEFHHIDPNKKDFDWKQMRLHQWKTICEELKKCVLLCSNCHREVHSERKYIAIGNANPILQPSIKESSGNCPNCNTPVYDTKFCSVICSAESKRKVKRPTKEELSHLIKTLPYTTIAKKYKVSDNAIRKWVKFYGI